MHNGKYNGPVFGNAWDIFINNLNSFYSRMTEKEDKKPTEYTFEDILNPNFNEFVHNYNPEKFLLDEDGRIGFDVFKNKTIQEAITYQQITRP